MSRRQESPGDCCLSGDGNTHFEISIQAQSGESCFGSVRVSIRWSNPAEIGAVGERAADGVSGFRADEYRRIGAVCPIGIIAW